MNSNLKGYLTLYIRSGKWGWPLILRFAFLKVKTLDYLSFNLKIFGGKGLIKYICDPLPLLIMIGK